MQLLREQITKIKQIGQIPYEETMYNVMSHSIGEDFVIFELKKNMNCRTCLEIKVKVPITDGELNFGKMKKI